MEGQTPIDQLEELTALAAHWAVEQERRVLCEGVPLSERELGDAKIIGVRQKENSLTRKLSACDIPSASVYCGLKLFRFRRIRC